jgi:CBS domain-containing protein
MQPLKDSMRRDVVVVRPEDTVRRAIELMASRKIGCVVSVDRKRPVGILTERDIVRLVSRGIDTEKARVGGVMSRKIVSMDSGKGIEEAIDLLDKKKIKKLPIIERGKLIGIVTMTDLLKSLRKIEGEESRKLRKTVKSLHLTKISLQSKIIALEERISRNA